MRVLRESGLCKLSKTPLQLTRPLSAGERPATFSERLEIVRSLTKENSRAVRKYATNLQQIMAALVMSGYTTLDAKAKALGVHRTTAWTIIRSKHKLGRLNAKTIERMLANPNLPPSVRLVLQKYLAERRQSAVNFCDGLGLQSGASHAVKQKESESETGIENRRNTQRVSGCRL